MEKDQTCLVDVIPGELTAGEPSVSLILEGVSVSLEPPVKPPKPPFIDRNLKAAKLVLKEGAREAIVETIKWFLLGRKRQPAEAGQCAANVAFPHRAM